MKRRCLRVRLRPLWGSQLLVRSDPRTAVGRDRIRPIPVDGSLILGAMRTADPTYETVRGPGTPPEGTGSLELGVNAPIRPRW